MVFIIEQLLKGYKYDTEIKIGEEIVKCHEIVLVNKSKMLSKYLENWNFEKSKVIDLNDTIIKNKDIFMEILKSWYDEQDVVCSIEELLIYKEYLEYLDCGNYSKLRPKFSVQDIIEIKLKRYYNSNHCDSYCDTDSDTDSNDVDYNDPENYYKYIPPILYIDDKAIDYYLHGSRITFLEVFNLPIIQQKLNNNGVIFVEYDKKKKNMVFSIANLKAILRIKREFLRFYYEFIIGNLTTEVEFFSIVYHRNSDKDTEYFDVNLTKFINSVINICYQYCNQTSYMELDLI